MVGLAHGEVGRRAAQCRRRRSAAMTMACWVSCRAHVNALRGMLDIMQYQFAGEEKRKLIHMLQAVIVTFDFLSTWMLRKMPCHISRWPRTLMAVWPSKTWAGRIDGRASHDRASSASDQCPLAPWPPRTLERRSRRTPRLCVLGLPANHGALMAGDWNANAGP